MIERNYFCDLCCEWINPEAIGSAYGLVWSADGLQVIQKIRSFEHHICLKCIQAIRSFEK